MRFFLATNPLDIRMENYPLFISTPTFFSISMELISRGSSSLGTLVYTAWRVVTGRHARQAKRPPFLPHIIPREGNQLRTSNGPCGHGYTYCAPRRMQEARRWGVLGHFSRTILELPFTPRTGIYR